MAEKGAFALYVRRLRGERTRKEISEASGVSIEYIRVMEEENRIPSQEILVKLANGLRVSEKEMIFKALQEKAPTAAIKKFFDTVSQKYPHLREILISFYDRGMVRSGYTDCLSKEGIRKELAEDEFHILEEAVLKIAFETLKGKNLFHSKIEELDPSKFGDAESYFSKLNILEANTKIDQVLQGWSYNKKHRELFFWAKSGHQKETLTPLVYKLDFTRKT